MDAHAPPLIGFDEFRYRRNVAYTMLITCLIGSLLFFAGGIFTILGVPDRFLNPLVNWPNLFGVIYFGISAACAYVQFQHEERTEGASLQAHPPAALGVVSVRHENEHAEGVGFSSRYSARGSSSECKNKSPESQPSPQDLTRTQMQRHQPVRAAALEVAQPSECGKGPSSATRGTSTSTEGQLSGCWTDRYSSVIVTRFGPDRDPRSVAYVHDPRITVCSSTLSIGTEGRATTILRGPELLARDTRISRYNPNIRQTALDVVDNPLIVGDHVEVRPPRTSASEPFILAGTDNDRRLCVSAVLGAVARTGGGHSDTSRVYQARVRAMCPPDVIGSGDFLPTNLSQARQIMPAVPARLMPGVEKGPECSVSFPQEVERGAAAAEKGTAPAASSTSSKQEVENKTVRGRDVAGFLMDLTAFRKSQCRWRRSSSETDVELLRQIHSVRSGRVLHQGPQAGQQDDGVQQLGGTLQEPSRPCLDHFQGVCRQLSDINVATTAAAGACASTPIENDITRVLAGSATSTTSSSPFDFHPTERISAQHTSEILDPQHHSQPVAPFAATEISSKGRYKESNTLIHASVVILNLGSTLFTLGTVVIAVPAVSEKPRWVFLYLIFWPFVIGSLCFVVYGFLELLIVKDFFGKQEKLREDENDGNYVTGLDRGHSQIVPAESGGESAAINAEARSTPRDSSRPQRRLVLIETLIAWSDFVGGVFFFVGSAGMDVRFFCQDEDESYLTKCTAFFAHDITGVAFTVGAFCYGFSAMLGFQLWTSERFGWGLFLALNRLFTSTSEKLPEHHEDARSSSHERLLSRGTMTSLFLYAVVLVLGLLNLCCFVAIGVGEMESNRAIQVSQLAYQCLLLLFAHLLLVLHSDMTKLPTQQPYRFIVMSMRASFGLCSCIELYTFSMHLRNAGLIFVAIPQNFRLHKHWQHDSSNVSFDVNSLAPGIFGTWSTDACERIRVLANLVRHSRRKPIE
ncbi:unnamed protein product [Amoebophrya sp. A120]|nr:unnamed protein product [Amoebophrya sp. A120]|eukprot:GSA120T00001742001.1